MIFLPVLVCENCNTYFEIHSKGEIVELGTCECGTKLKYYDSLEDYLNEQENVSNDEDYLFYHLINSSESSIARIILYSINELPFPMDPNELVGYLRGSKSSLIIDYQLNKLNSYSCLSYFSKKRLNRYINTLERWGILETKFKPKINKETIILTGKGKDFLLNNENLSFKIYGRKSADFMKGVDKSLFDILRELRKRIAQEQDIQAYKVCNNESLLLMAKKKPKSYDSMKKIKGIGKRFMEKYGDLFLNLINQYERQ